MTSAQTRIALTGATGFIGGALARAFVAAGYPVRALVRPQSFRKPLPPEVERVFGDLTDPAGLEALLTDATVLVHCAGAVRGAREADFTRANTAPLAGLGTAADNAGVSRIVLLSSLAAREPSVSPYAASKRGGETALLESARQAKSLILRPPAVYGPGDRELLPLFKTLRRGFAPVWGDPDARFSLIYIEDLVAAVMLGLSLGQGVFELHDGRPDGYSLNDIIELMQHDGNRRIRRIPISGPLLDFVAGGNLALGRLFGYAPMLTPWKLRELRHPRWVCDNSALHELTGWQPKILLPQGLPLALQETTGDSAGRGHR